MANERLGRNFHKTFRPERFHIAALLQFIAKGGTGSDQKIGQQTGIPTGETSGKVPVTIDYSEAMGLILSKPGSSSTARELELTDFGRILLLEDPYLKTDISQHLVHFNLCRSQEGADTWFLFFNAGVDSFGKVISLSDIESYFERQYGPSKGKYLSPMLNCYLEESSLLLCGALKKEGDYFVRKPSPINEEMILGYGAWLVSMIEQFYPDEKQVSLDDLVKLGVFSIPFWNLSQGQEVINLIAERGIISLDRHMKPWLVSPATTSKEAWKKIYDDLL